MIGFIYIVTNIVTQQKYIGRKIYTKGWENYFGSSKLLLRDIERLGRDKFTRDIIEECETIEQLRYRELYWQLHFKVKESPDYYNLTYATEGFDTTGTRFSYSKEELEDIWPKERREIQSKRWKDPALNPNNIPAVAAEKSKNMRINNPMFREDIKKKLSDIKSQPFQLEYCEKIYTFKNIEESRAVFGHSAISVRKLGVKKNNPYKGLKFLGFL